ncbi:MAG: hypothetical protein MUD14_21465 [Hydrococcus sp. Prado102]|jgi:hypothetical protein|nr:hypothetical protein [Hydrococcus sp. Prado102]
MSADKLSLEELREIEQKLPPQFAALKDKYPVTIAAVARDWDKPAYPQGYRPQLIEIYYEDDCDSAIFIWNGELVSLELEESVANPSFTVVDIDDETAYVQIEGRVILNRLGGAILPNVALDPEIFLRSALGKLSES